MKLRIGDQDVDIVKLTTNFEMAEGYRHFASWDPIPNLLYVYLKSFYPTLAHTQTGMGWFNAMKFDVCVYFIVRSNGQLFIRDQIHFDASDMTLRDSADHFQYVAALQTPAGRFDIANKAKVIDLYHVIP